ncbi:phosphonopyruvate decarboxylase-like protein [Tieghemostelium lacteum]|uniref:Phosphonopyruvate decarboxylase-like protein n=1 Tax=Tieghemostelium lacteum TaxID=361077 RepID=A0A152A5D6_TIELA|nr:phosphonopyruvate decarboxylase-like protein [Tieghemostelium lacteum]|eukprot:KYR01291.1 phosphonopyruvate decarboxylase-like protein [Tieghemostelium lacteum]
MIDGLADVSLPKYSRKTPLEIAKIPIMDAMAATGINGSMDPVEPGLACGSDTAHLSIFGYDPRIYYRGRGAFESMGAGLDMKPGDIAFKSNFATLNTDSGIVISRRADRNFEELGPILCDYLTGIKLPSFPQYQIDVKYATEHRCGIRVRGPNLTDSISGTDPLTDNLPLLKSKPLNDDFNSINTAAVVNELSVEIQKALENHPVNIDRRKKLLSPANVVLLRGCGVIVEAPTFFEKYALRAFMIAPTCIIAGLGMSIDIKVVEAPGATGDYHTNFHSKATTLLENIQKDDFDFGFLHVKAVDDAGHDKNDQLKIDFLEKIDQMLDFIINQLSNLSKLNISICLTGDHSTPVMTGDHSCEPVPFTISKPKLISKYLLNNNNIDSLRNDFSLIDNVTSFSEINCSKGSLGRFNGGQVMNIIQQYMNKQYC